MPEKQSPTIADPQWAGAYDELRVLARRALSRERSDHTLQPTALVHEVFLRSSRDRRFHGLDRAGILSLAARTMRDVLVEHARRKNARKRGGAARRLPLDETVASYEERAVDLVALDDALSRLAAFDAQLARIVELRFFGGLTEDEVATVFQVSGRTVRRAWRVARQWLARELGEETADDRPPLAADQTDP